MRRRSGFWSRRGSVGTLLVGLVVVAVAAPSWATPGAVLWTARFDGPTMSDDSAAAFALSPDGAKLYVTGKSPFNAFNGYDYATRAYDTGTGATLWTKYYNDASVDADDMATAITVSPDGSKVFVTGSSAQPGCRGITTVAMNATTGGALWTQRYCQPQGYVTDSSPSIAVSGDGTKVFVAGRSSLNGIGTITYNATTGALLWTKSTTANATAVKVAVSPDSTKVFVTGYRVANNYSWQTIAYSTSNGAQLWSKSYFGSSSARPSALAVSPDGSKVFVTGFSLPDPSTGTDFETIAYSATTGAIVWAKRLAGSGNGTAYDQAKAIHVSPDGTKVFVTGITLRPVTGDDYLTAAYRASDGTFLWGARYDGPAHHGEAPNAITVSPDNTRVYVTGASNANTTCTPHTFCNDYATVAYVAGTGAVAWTARVDGPVNRDDAAVAVAVSPNNTKVFVTGTSQPTTLPNGDYFTIAYSAN